MAADRPGDAAFDEGGGGWLAGEPGADEGREAVAGEQGEGGGVLVVADRGPQVGAQAGQEPAFGQAEPVDGLPGAHPVFGQRLRRVPGVP
ncbi:hypothetical protein LO762_15985 [Actinocorallia sp. API 0066]|uniref:hypothetical protein n=1 Tax=Actinocorallia sp. API 0066 TaxID=2896846 RepID=UPI001E57CDDA|nr:hypothetical protein [Actinocorallia sp. API 0066]MCD0450678.1 hypothetical protein [Actinocorallia sp. API 0066]